MRDIQNLIASYTANGITARTCDLSSCNAHNITLILKIDRANVSRVLNQLHRENRLIKPQGRPTLCLDAGVIHSFPTKSVPYTLPVGRDIQECLHQDKPVRVWRHSSRRALTYTGIHTNKSLHSLYQELLAILIYPQALQSLTLYVPCGEGKHHFPKFFIEKAKELQLLGRHTQILEHVLSDTVDEQNQIYSICPETPAFLILGVQCSDMHTVQQAVEELQRQHATLHNSWKVCYLFHGINADIAQLQRFIDYLMMFPSYEIRTLEERLEIILAEIQRRSGTLSQTIYLHKNVIACMALADKAYTTHISLRELRRSIIRTHYSFIQRKANVIDITFEHLSDDMLNNIRDVSSHFAQLHSVLDLFDGDMLCFIPQTSCRFFTALHHAILNEQHLIDSSDDGQIVPTCSPMLRKTEKIEINMIRSTFVKEPYDLMFPLLTSTPPKQKETMILISFECLQNLITELENSICTHSFTPSHDLETKRTDIVTEDIARIIQSKMEAVLPQDERALISTYLQLAIQELEAKTPILFVYYRGDIAANYEKYIYSASPYENRHSLDYSEAWQRGEFHLFLDHVCDGIQQINSHETPLLFSDIAPLTKIGGQINSRLHIDVYSYAPISLPLILNTVFVMKHGHTQEYSQPQTLNFPASSLSESSRTLIDRISRQTPQQSLVFLDANKASSSLMAVLLNILKKLKLGYSNETTIRFIIHGVFVIERAIRSDPLPNKKAREIIDSRADVYNMISLELNELNNVLSISISKAEITTIAQVFLEYM